MRIHAAVGRTAPLLVCLVLGCHRHGLDPTSARGSAGGGAVAVDHVDHAGLRRLPLAVLEDKIRGGWAGKMIGVTRGAPFEFRSRGAIIEGDIGAPTPDVEGALSQDDLYVNATFARVLDEKGLDADLSDYAAAFAETRYDLFHANAAARRVLAQGMPPERAGDPLYNLHANDIDFQIESDFIGLMTPGLPAEANRYAARVGRLVAYGDGLYGGLFVASLYAAAFFEASPRALVEEALRSLPAESGYAAAVRDVIAWHDERSDWRTTWRRIEDRWAKDDACPSGALEPFDIDARLNGAYVTMALLYGGGDLDRTMDIAIRAGQDTDCNAATAAGVLGAMVGYLAIPEGLRAGVPKVARRRFEHTRLSLDDLVASTRRRAIAATIRAGGALEGDTLLVPEEAPSPPPPERFDMGIPSARIEATDAAWTWKGPWTGSAGAMDGGQTWHGKRSSRPGAEAELCFSGSAVAVLGPLGPSGGRADVFLDGEPQARSLDGYAPPHTWDHDLWHAYGLADGRHTLRIVLRGADRAASGTELVIFGAVSFGRREP
jgi:hypothetical protein